MLLDVILDKNIFVIFEGWPSEEFIVSPEGFFLLEEIEEIIGIILAFSRHL